MNFMKLIIYGFIVSLFFFPGCRKKDDNLFHNIKPHDFLSDSKYEKLVIEVQYVEGYDPAPGVLDELKNFLDKRLNKSGGIMYVLESIASPGKAIYTESDLKSIEDKNRTHYSKGNTLTTYVFFADADYAGNNGNSKVLGLTYDVTSLCIFKKTVSDYSGGTFQPSDKILEATVVEHEFGHILGLVNNGTPLQSFHQDGSNGKHCNNKTCLMYYNVETTDVISNLLGGEIPDLDPPCVTDLIANGGK